MEVRYRSGSLYWKKSLGKMHAFVTSKTKDILEVAPAIPIWNNDPLMRIKEKVRVPTVQVEQSEEEEEDEEEIPTTIPHFARKSPAKPDSKRKTIATSPEKVMKKPQSNKVRKKKRTLLYAASSASKKSKV